MSRIAIFPWPWLVLAVSVPAGLQAATTVRLPAWACTHPDALFVDGFSGGSAVQRLPSSGSGGAFPGSGQRTVNVPGIGARTYYLHVPANYPSLRPLPLVFALHGAAGSSADAPLAAQGVRDDWAAAADAGGFIVVAPVASGGSGGWIVPPPAPSDYDTFAAVIADVEAAYDIDRSRRIGWGFSAGAHVMYDLVFNQFSDDVTIDSFAAIAISAGTLAALACTTPGNCDTLVAGASRQIPLVIRVGSTDPLRPYAEDDRDRLLANGWVAGDTLSFDLFSGGHTYTPAQLAQNWQQLCPFQVLP